MYHNVGVSGHDLLLGGKLGALLELEIADGSRESEVAVDPSEVDETTSGGDPCLLTWGEKRIRKPCAFAAQRAGSRL